MEFNSTDDITVPPPSSTMTSEVNSSATNSSLDSRCGNLDENYMIVWNAFQWWCEGIFFTGIGLVRYIISYIIPFGYGHCTRAILNLIPTDESYKTYKGSL